MADEFQTADLRRAWQQVEPPAVHLEETTWEGLACDELTPFERDRALEHITACGTCQAIYRTLSEIRQGAAQFDPGVPQAAPVADEAPASAPWWRKTWVLGALGATAVVALVVLTVPFGQEDYSDDVTRGGGLPPITITRPAEGVPFDRVFTWKPVNSATRYHLIVYTADGARAFEVRDLTTAGVKVSEGVRMIPGRYFVEVTAFGGEQELAKSALTPFDMK